MLQQSCNESPPICEHGLIVQSRYRRYYLRQLRREQILFWRRLSVCLSVRPCVRLAVCRKSRKLLIRNCCNLVRIWTTVNTKSGWKLVTFDLDLVSCFPINLSDRVWPSNFIFGVEMRFDIIYVLMQFQDHRAKIKVTQQKKHNACLRSTRT